ncbi:MAG TPA: spore coat protein U domain-containing protein [Ramlibacter sp.]|uniref:spore coat protein U domain-containing protein n=1 Tax=Ramlibacter sp. TaxID=1917967 RepID=UPI002ED18BDA
MSKIFRMTAIAAFAALAASASMAETMNMDVKASVTGTCKLAAANALDFGALDPVAAPAVTGKTTTITYLCTKGKTPAALTINGGSGSTTSSMVHATVVADLIPFSLTWSTTLPAGLGMGTGKEVTVTVSGDIAAGVYSNLTAGNYSKTLTVDFTP